MKKIYNINNIRHYDYYHYNGEKGLLFYKDIVLIKNILYFCPIFLEASFYKKNYEKEKNYYFYMYRRLPVSIKNGIPNFDMLCYFDINILIL